MTIDGLSKETLKVVFINGLLEKIRAKVEMPCPKMLEEVIVHMH